VRALGRAGFDVVVTQSGIAVNPKNAELKQRLVDAGLNIVDIQELKDKAERITGKPQPLPEGGRVVAQVFGREGNLQDTIRQVL